MNIIIALLALSFLIIVHELGHFAVAKLAGIKVLEFSLFMGPKLFEIKKGETVYSIRAIPLGGFVKMEGEEERSDDKRAFSRQPVLTRAAVIAAGPVMNILAALIILIFILSSTGYFTTTVSQVVEGSPAHESGIRTGDKILSYDGKPILYPSDVQLFLFGGKGKEADIEILRNGQKISAKIKPEIYPSKRYILGFTTEAEYGENSLIVRQVSQGYPAQAAGMKAQDKIVRIDDADIKSKKEIREYLEAKKGQEVTIWVERGEQLVKLNPVKPVIDQGSEFYDIGIQFAQDKGNIIQVIKNSWLYSVSIGRNVLYSLVWLISGRVEFNQVSGPIGIVSSIGDVVQQGPTLGMKVLMLLNFMVFISINLGLFNLIPFPALDGSKLVLLLVEAIREKPIPPEKEAFISMIGFALLILLMIFATYNDLLRIFRGG